ncbi:hypothetical protein PSm6_44330 [Pseudomonas solani]|uniref:Uncharacterized protein n=1 Tax=Pseudomonas solani TaxID=2731552 RepID=A0ABM7LET0_9PSED|nr:hypothetical protein PSm6_44330 [Pseudomonas solani]
MDAVLVGELARGESVAGGADLAHLVRRQHRTWAGGVVRSGHGFLGASRPWPRLARQGEEGGAARVGGGYAAWLVLGWTMAPLSIQ